MLRKDIENIYTDTVKEYMNKGYRIYSPTMGGSQGEIAKIDLTNDKDVIRKAKPCNYCRRIRKSLKLR